jgi:hypothetical protein
MFFDFGEHAGKGRGPGYLEAGAPTEDGAGGVCRG